MDRAAPGRAARDATRPDRDFVAIFDANAARLVRFAVFLGAEDPEDVVQEAFSRLFERHAAFIGDLSQAGGYLRRTVLNIVRDRARRSVRTRKVLRLQALTPGHRAAIASAVANTFRAVSTCRFSISRPLRVAT